MSSPLHSLRKNKVPLFPGHMIGNRPIPFRHPDLSEDESKMLEEITSGMVVERRKQDPVLPLPASIEAALKNQPIGEGGASSPHQNVPSMLRRFGPHGMNLSTSPPAAEAGEGGPTPPPSDKELMRMMMNRIAVLEQQNQTQGEDIRAKDKKIKILEDRLLIAEKARKEVSVGKAFGELETHCLLLQQQVHEMETFLAEYGMVWVGDSGNNLSDHYIKDKLDDVSDDDDDEDEVESKDPSLWRGASNATSDSLTIKPNAFGMLRQDTSLASGSDSGHSLTARPSRTNQAKLSPRSIDFDVLLDNIRDLNVLAGAGEAQIKKTSDGARFEVPESVHLTLYANGLLMFDGPFRPYTDPSTRQCVQDLLDGYFPSELQPRYPDGVPFIVTDLRGTHYQPRAAPLAFTGEGQTLGGDIGPSRLIPKRVIDQTKKVPLPSIGGLAVASQTVTELTATTASHLRKPMSQKQFLNKLPKSVIKDGKVIDVRDSVGKTLAGGMSPSSSPQLQPSVTLVSTGVTKEMSGCLADGPRPSCSRTSQSDTQRSYKGHGDVTTLRVMAEQGLHTYIVKMKFSETVGDLRTYLDQQRRPQAPYDIVSTFPHQVHRNNNLSLEESGLTPNAVLHLKPHKP